MIAAPSGLFDSWTANAESDGSVTRIALPQMLSLPQFGGAYERRMLWGCYRPGLYLGAVHLLDEIGL